MSFNDHDMEVRRVAHGGAGVRAGTPDYGQNGDDRDGRRTDAADTIANILHWLAANGATEADIDTALDRGRSDFEAER